MKRCFFLGLIVCLAGCAGVLDKPEPARRYFSMGGFDQAPSKHSSTKADPGAANPGAAAPFSSVRLKRPTISPAFSGREFVYMTGENRFETDFYNLFLAKPADMAFTAIRAELARSGLFGEIVDSSSAFFPDYVLETNVARLYGDFSGKTPQAVVEASFFLIRDTRTDYAVTLSKSYVRMIPLAAATPDALAAAYDRGLAEAVADFVADVRALPAAAAKPKS